MEKKLEKMIDRVKDSDYSVAITDRDWEGGGPFLLYVNPHWEKMTGYKMEEVLGKNPKILQGPMTNKDDLKGVREALTGPDQVYSGGTWNHRRNGQPFQIRWIIYNLSFIGDYYVAMQRDVTGWSQEKIDMEVVDKFKGLVEIIKLLM